MRPQSKVLVIAGARLRVGLGAPTSASTATALPARDTSTFASGKQIGTPFTESPAWTDGYIVHNISVSPAILGLTRPGNTTVKDSLG